MTRLTVLEAATYFGISKRTVFRRISEGKFKSEKVNGKVLVILDDDIDIATVNASGNAVNDDKVAKIDMQKELQIRELELENTSLRQQLEMQIQKQISLRMNLSGYSFRYWLVVPLIVAYLVVPLIGKSLFVQFQVAPPSGRRRGQN